MESRTPNPSRIQETGVDVNVEKPALVEGRRRQDSASAEMLAIVDNTKLAPPAQSISRATTPDLFPDSMESRVAGSPNRVPSPGMEELSLDSMGSRIRSRGLAA